jgi:hypothetical protein
MTKIDKTQLNKQQPPQQPSKGAIVQQFASGGSAVPTPQLPYDVETVQGSKVKPAPKPK